MLITVFHWGLQYLFQEPSEETLPLPVSVLHIKHLLEHYL